ncbi:MAG TPA: hypothetical protein VEA78_00070, partial [Acidimicrobiales bacterium]|nr:hypothetical protein [Acidimicrobiales bacterium]
IGTYGRYLNRLTIAPNSANGTALTRRLTAQSMTTRATRVGIDPPLRHAARLVSAGDCRIKRHTERITQDLSPVALIGS